MSEPKDVKDTDIGNQLDRQYAWRGGDEANWDAWAELKRWPAADVLGEAIRRSTSSEPSVRASSCDAFAIAWRGLKQSGAEDADDCRRRLTELLFDPVGEVALRAAVAASDIDAPIDTSRLKARIHHADATVRYAVATALGGRHDDACATEALIELSRDADEEVRDWSTFYLANQRAGDTAAIADALLARLDEPNPEIRGEALIGLANHLDPRGLPFVKRELAGPFQGAWFIEAAAKYADPDFLPMLLAMRLKLDSRDREAFEGELDEAIRACRTRT